MEMNDENGEIRESLTEKKRFSAVKSETGERIKVLFDLISAGYSDYQICRKVKTDWRVGYGKLHSLLQAAHANHERILQAFMQKSFDNIIRTQQHLAHRLYEQGEYYKANLVWQNILDRTHGKPTQKIDVKHENTMPQTLIQINGKEINLNVNSAINEGDKPIPITIEPIKEPEPEKLPEPEKKWYERD